MASTVRMVGGDSDDDDDELWWRERVRPDNEVPVCVPVNLTLGSSDDVAAYIAGMTVFSNGLQFTLEVITRPGFRLGDGSGVADVVYGDRQDGTDLLLGFEYADGRRHTSVGAPPAGGDDAAEAISLMDGGGEGADNSVSVGYFLSPLPPPDEFSIHFAWESVGIAETKTTIDSAPIIEAARRVRELWPWEAASDEGDEDAPPHVRLPKGGWFAQVFRGGTSS